MNILGFFPPNKGGSQKDLFVIDLTILIVVSLLFAFFLYFFVSIFIDSYKEGKLSKETQSVTALTGEEN